MVMGDRIKSAAERAADNAKQLVGQITDICAPEAQERTEQDLTDAAQAGEQAKDMA